MSIGYDEVAAMLKDGKSYDASRLGEDGIAHVISALKDKDPEISIGAASALGWTRNPQHIHSLMQALDDPNNDVSIVSAISLSRIGKEAIPPLIKRLKDRGNRPGYAILALKDIGAPSNDAIRKELTDLAEEKPQGGDDARAIDDTVIISWAAGQLKIADAAPALKRLLTHGNAAIRRESLLSLHHIEGDKMLQFALDALKDEQPDVRLSVIWILGQIKDELSIRALFDILPSNSREEREEALRALTESRDPRIVPIAVERIPSIEDFHSFDAVFKLLRYFAHAKDLVVLLSNPKKEVRKQAAKILGEIKSKESVLPLIGLLSDPEYDVRIEAIHAIRINDELPAAREQLIKMFADEHPVVRVNLINAIGTLEERGADDYAGLLLQSLDDDNWGVRVSAIDALGSMGVENAVPLLMALLNDDNEAVQSASAYSLARLSEKRPVDLNEVKRLLDGNVARIAIIGDPGAAESMKRSMAQQFLAIAQGVGRHGSKIIGQDILSEGSPKPPRNHGDGFFRSAYIAQPPRPMAKLGAG